VSWGPGSWTEEMSHSMCARRHSLRLCCYVCNISHQWVLRCAGSGQYGYPSRNRRLEDDGSGRRKANNTRGRISTASGNMHASRWEGSAPRRRCWSRLQTQWRAWRPPEQPNATSAPTCVQLGSSALVFQSAHLDKHRQTDTHWHANQQTDE